MRVLVVHRSPLPGEAAATTGAALRAWHHAEALRAAGHDVRTLAREADERGGFRTPAHLRRLAREHAPDWILSVAMEDAPALGGVAPLVVDLYAPRVLEAAFEGTQHEDAVRTLRAVHAADEVIFSNNRQRWYTMGLLGVAGWDLSTAPGVVVPLVAEGVPRKKPRRPKVIAGGYPWPWARAEETLARAVKHLRGRADVVSYGLPAVEGVDGRGIVPLEEWRAACAGATVALDRYAPNVERELAQSFRQADYIGAGVPIVTDPWVVIAGQVRSHRAGWVDEPLEDALDAALSEDRSPGMQAMARRYAREAAEAPLVAWVPRERVRVQSAMVGSVELARAEERGAADRHRAEAAEAEVGRKRAEVAELNARVSELTGAVARLSDAMGDVAAFRRETVTVLGTRLAGQSGEAEHLRRELEILRADVEKKDLELRQAHADRERLGGLLGRLRR